MTDRPLNDSSFEHSPLEVEVPRISDDVVDAFFDRELTEGARDQLFARLRADLPRCAEVAQTQRMVSMLREPVEGPDVSGRVLGELSRRRRFLPARLRKVVTTGRLVGVGVGLAAVLTIAVIDRMSPGTLRVTDEPRPVSGVVASSAEEMKRGMSQLAGAVVPLEVRATGPDVATGRVVAKKQVFLTLTPGVTSAKLLQERSGETDSLVVYRGAGPDTRMGLPDAVYFDRNAAVVLPLGHLSPCKTGMMGWVGASSENLYLLPAVAPECEKSEGVAPEEKPVVKGP